MAINILLPELLWEIFMMNADMVRDYRHYDVTSNHRALLITKRSSHVCQLWREVILNSSHLWGRIVDLERFLTLRSNKWMDLVMHRTGKSDLWIQTRARGIHHRPYEISVFLAKYWDRIRSLKVWVDASHHFVKFWTTLKQPAPRLEVFELYLEPRPQHPKFCTNIFSNHAPLLRVFHGNAISCHPHPGWTSQIRNISLQSTCFTVRHLLDILSQALQLESLNLWRACQDAPVEDDIPTHTIFLPNLQNISITDNIRTSAGLLCPLVLPMTCRIRLQMNLCAGRLDKEAIGLEMLLCGPLAFNSTKALTFQLKDRDLVIHDFTHGSDLKISKEITEVHAFHQAIVPCVLKSLHLPNITKLDLSLDANISPTSCPIIHQSLLSFSGVKVLKATLPMLEEILTFRESTPPAIPSLRELSIVGMACYSTNLTLVISDFIAWRKEIGFPIEHLDLSLSVFRNVNAKALETMTDLKVSWRRKKKSCIWTYICGSGDPEKLCR
ncbi:hypothetical protein GALMADRAFT_155131 [Galerina marginata CBS 339.88]|uniref:F-box domain-containing protein n=1 Tax=Galerina marginata (strain CBS 339.88) TaxID=685588 RepID=A0A067T4S3_GALM3|nr:hypothetical protein GALMADRAFT_155131 [Galerina marginata CBS 339.88]